jgi:S1-C subfamily serine protease
VRFYRAGVPVLFFFTGTHADYHGPGDTADRLDTAGMARVAAAAIHVIERLAERPRPAYAALPPPARPGRGSAGGAFFGIMANGRDGADGVHVGGVVPGSPAARLGVAEGDVIVRFGDVPVVSFDAFQGAVRARRPGERVSVVFLRDGRARIGSETLDARP